MKASRRLGPIARVARQRERDAARQLGDTVRQVELEQKQLDDLFAYREQYIANFQIAGKAGLSVVQLRDYQLFLQRLEDVITQQKKKVLACHENCAQSQENWRDKYGNSKMINKVVEKRRDIEDKEQNSREQREQDDRAK